MERLARKRVAVVAVKLPGVIQKHDVEWNRAGKVQPAAHVRRERHHRHRREQHGVKQDLQAREPAAVGHRQHRDAGAGVFLLAIERQRPEMRRRPQKNNQEQQQRVRRDVAGDRGPAEHRRCGAGGAADDNVLRRRVLEPDGVDDRVTDEGSKRQHRRQHIDPGDEDDHGQDADSEREYQRLGRGEASGRQRSIVRALHHGIGLAIEDVVERGRGARRERDAEGAEDEGAERRRAGRGQEHADHRGEHDERHHARLGELEVLARECRETPRAERRGARRIGGGDGCLHGLRFSERVAGRAT